MGLFSSPQTARAGEPFDASQRAVVPVTTSSGTTSVDASTIPNAMQSVAIGSTVDLICSLGSELPIHVYRGEGSGRVKLKSPGYFEDLAGDGNGTPDLIYQVLMSWCLRGNLFGDILERSPRGDYVTQFSPLYPDGVKGREVDGRLLWTVNGREFPAARMLHRRVMPVPGHVMGRSPITMHAATIGVSLSSTQFGGQWFAEGAHPTALLTSDQQLGAKQAATAKERFLAALAGRREPVVLGKGWDYKPLQMNPEESQFLQTQGYSEAQCARIFGPGFAEILGYESGGNLTYANIESRATHLLVFGMNKWLRRLDRLLTSMLPSPQYARVDRDAMLESTTLTRYQAHALALTNRWKTVNEVRGDEEMAPVPWGENPTDPAAQQGPTQGDAP
jgi:HK97 family phage portal protein